MKFLAKRAKALLSEYMNGKRRFSAEDNIVYDNSVGADAFVVESEYSLSEENKLLGVGILFEIDEDGLTVDEKRALVNLLGSLVEKIRRNSYGLVGDFVKEGGVIIISDRENQYSHQNDGKIFIPLDNLKKALKSTDYRMEAEIKLFHEFWHESLDVNNKEAEVVKFVLNSNGEVLDHSNDEHIAYFEELWLTYRNRLELFKAGIIPEAAVKFFNESNNLSGYEKMQAVAMQMAIQDVNVMPLAAGMPLITDGEKLKSAFTAMDRYADGLSMLNEWDAEVKRVFSQHGIDLTNIWQILDQSIHKEGTTVRIGISNGVLQNAELAEVIDSLLKNKELEKRNIVFEIDKGDAIDVSDLQNGNYAFMLQMDNENFQLENAKTKAFAFSHDNVQNEMTVFHSILLTLLAKYLSALNNGEEASFDDLHTGIFEYKNGVFNLASAVISDINKQLINTVKIQVFKVAA